MNLEKQISRIVMIDRMIQLKSTGTPKEISRKMNVSESTVFRLLKALKENINRDIEFDRHLNSYVYLQEYGEIDFKKILFAVEE
ncbi:MAG: helix-turn-helix domain-containing protein [Cytophagales bacterium]